MSTGGTSTTSQLNLSSPEQQAYAAGTLPYVQQAQQALPISNFTSSNPQQTAGLSPTQQWVSSIIPSLGQTNTAQQSALDALSQISSTNSQGLSPATQAAMQTYTQTQQPQIENTLATMGLGNSGIGAQLLSQGQTQALSSLLGQQTANQLSAAQSQGSIGSNLSSQATQAAQLGQAQGTTEQTTAQSALTSAYNDYLRQQQLSSQLFGLPSTNYSGNTGSSITQPLTGLFGK